MISLACTAHSYCDLHFSKINTCGRCIHDYKSQTTGVKVGLGPYFIGDWSAAHRA
jgi:hypothetical protein